MCLGLTFQFARVLAGCTGGALVGVEGGGGVERVGNGVGALAGRSSTDHYMRKKYKRWNRPYFIFTNYMKHCVLSSIPK